MVLPALRPAKVTARGLARTPSIAGMVPPPECIVADMPDKRKQASSRRRRPWAATSDYDQKRPALNVGPSGAFFYGRHQPLGTPSPGSAQPRYA